MQPKELPSQNEKLIKYRFHRFIELALRSDEFIELPSEEAYLIEQVDGSSNLVHVEYPGEHNRIAKPRVWSIKAWRESEARHEFARKKSADDRLAFDNYKYNLYAVAEALSQLTSMSVSDCMDTAKKVLKKNPENLSGIGVQLRHPYYRGEYVILPFKKER